MSSAVSLLVMILLLLLIAAFNVFMARLRQYLVGESYKDTDKQKNIKEKHYHMASRLSKPVNWRVLLSHEVQRWLPDQKTEAIIRYRQLTGADVQDATQTIAYHIAYPNHVPARFIHYDLTDEQIASLHKMLRQGRRKDAHKRYQEMTGIDQFAADIGLDILEQQVLIEEESFARLREIADKPFDEDETEQEQPIVQTKQKG